ncbi:MAG TPA: ZIP family metal transporter [Steroidobacteraceae bacterium]|jgi:ZIP family zinc transporter|nr:ZIP family metal transporter [Steroidobacteraceae bacterium]
MNQPLLLGIAAAAFASTMLGGLLALKLRDKLHLILGFSAGAVIGVAFFDLLPEAIAFGGASRRPATLMAFAALGFLAYLLLDRIATFHGAAGPRRPLAAAVLCLHSLLDGIAIGLAFQASRSVGIVVAIAVLTHDFSDGINTMSVVLKQQGSRAQGLRWLLTDAIAPVLGVLSTYFFRLPGQAFGTMLALFAGFFLYIGASDLIPESFHAHPKFLTTAMTLLGSAVLYLAISVIGP